MELADKGQALPATGLLYDTDHIPHTPKKANLSADSIYIVQMGFSKAMRKLKLGMPKTELLSSSTAKKEWVGIQPNAKAEIYVLKIWITMVILDEDDKEYCGTGIPKFETNLNFSALQRFLTSLQFEWCIRT